MDKEIDLTTADRDVLIAIIVRQQAIIESLEKRIPQLAGQAKSGGSRRMPGLKPKAEGKPAQPQQPRKRRPHGFARTRMTPTQRVEQVVEQCPDCGTQLSGGWTQRTRQVIDLPRVPVEVAERVYIARTCPQCQRCCTPTAQLGGMVLDQQRLGVNLVSLIAALREEARLPFRTSQWYLDTVHGLRLSLGAIVDATQRVARKAQAVMADIVERIRGSLVVHADATGGREDGHNGYVWTFSTPTQRYFLRRGRGKTVVDEVLGEEFAGVLVSDCYAAYHHYDGPKQRCWAHLLRDVHDLRALYPDDHQLGQWADAVHQLYRQGTAFTHPSEQQRRAAQLALERRLLALCGPYRDDPSGRPNQAVPTHGEPHQGALQGALRLRGSSGSATGQQRRRAQPAPSGDQPKGQRWHPLQPGHRYQDDTGLALRYLAGPRLQPPHRLPTTAHFPSTLNCYLNN